MTTSIVAALLAGIGVVVAGRAIAPSRRVASGARREARSRGARGRLTAPPDRTVLARVVLVGLAVWGVVVLGVVATVVGAAGGTAVRWLMLRDRTRRRQAEVERAVPDLVDLFLIAASAGRPVASSLAVVAARAPGPVRPSVDAAAERLRRGLPLDECLRGLGADLGSSGAALTAALAQAAASGVPLVPLLEGVAATARDERRRRSEAAARRLPVTMLFPLAACVLPAAVLLAVVPVLLVSIRSLSP